MARQEPSIYKHNPTTPASFVTGKFPALTVIMALWLTCWEVPILWKSMKWPMVQDAPILTYMGWLASRGMTLYKEVAEVQFPGAVLVYRDVQIVFGTTDLGFRIFDLCVLLLVLLCMLSITRRQSTWFAAVFAFAYFFWQHTGNLDGISALGQRDFIVAALVLLEASLLVAFMNKEEPRLLFLAGACLGMAFTIKPTAAAYILLLVPYLITQSFRRSAILRAGLWVLAGTLVPLAVVLVYLLSHHALVPFFTMEKNVLPLYVAVAQPSFTSMLQTLVQPARLLPLLAFVPAFVMWRFPAIRRQPESQILLAGMLIGLVSYFVQHKGFFYHREPFFVFFFFWSSWVMLAATKGSSQNVAYACAFVLIASTLVYPHFLRAAQVGPYEDTMQQQLQSAHALDRDGQLQCIDLTDGCITTMLRAKKMMATGTIDEYLLFNPGTNMRLQAERSRFLDELERVRPEYFVVSNLQWPTSSQRGYEKLANWPQFEQFLWHNYSVIYESSAPDQRGYRLYARSQR